MRRYICVLSLAVVMWTAACNHPGDHIDFTYFGRESAQLEADLHEIVLYVSTEIAPQRDVTESDVASFVIKSLIVKAIYVAKSSDAWQIPEESVADNDGSIAIAVELEKLPDGATWAIYDMQALETEYLTKRPDGLADDDNWIFHEVARGEP